MAVTVASVWVLALFLQLGLKPVYLLLQVHGIFLHFFMVLLKRDDLVADHIHGNKDSFFLLGNLDRVNGNVSCNSGTSLLVVDFALLDKDGDAILHGATEAKGTGDKVAKMRNIGHEE